MDQLYYRGISEEDAVRVVVLVLEPAPSFLGVDLGSHVFISSVLKKICAEF